MAKQQLTEKERSKYIKALENYQKIKNTWTTEDEKTKQKIIDAINKMLNQTGIEMYEDDECTTPTTKETLQRKDIKHLIEDFDMILQAIQGKINQKTEE